MIPSSSQFRVDADNPKPLCQAKCKVRKVVADSPWKQCQDRQWEERKWAAEGWHQQRSIKAFPLLLIFFLLSWQTVRSYFALLSTFSHGTFTGQPLTKTFWWPFINFAVAFSNVVLAPKLSWNTVLQISPNVPGMLYGTGVVRTLLKQRRSKQR